MKCRRCKREVPSHSNYCSYCGLDFNKKNSLLIPLISVCSALIVCSFIFVLFFNKSEEKPVIIDNEDKNIPTVSEDNGLYSFNLFDASKVEVENPDSELGKNVIVTNIFCNNYKQTSKYKYAYILIENNNNVPIRINSSLKFYDKDGYQIDKNSRSELINANSKKVFEISILDDTYGYNNVKFTYTVSKINSYDTVYNNISFKYHKDEKNNIVASATNNESVDIFSVTGIVIYYKNNEIVFADDIYIGSLKSGETKEGTAYYSSLKLTDDYMNSKAIEYDIYEISLSSAYNSDSKNY